MRLPDVTLAANHFLAKTSYKLPFYENEASGILLIFIIRKPLVLLHLLIPMDALPEIAG
jgi:hypothetical protein